MLSNLIIRNEGLLKHFVPNENTSTSSCETLHETLDGIAKVDEKYILILYVPYPSTYRLI